MRSSSNTSRTNFGRVFRAAPNSSSKYQKPKATYKHTNKSVVLENSCHERIEASTMIGGRMPPALRQNETTCKWEHTQVYSWRRLNWQNTNQFDAAGKKVTDKIWYFLRVQKLTTFAIPSLPHKHYCKNNLISYLRVFSLKTLSQEIATHGYIGTLNFIFGLRSRTGGDLPQIFFSLKS